MPANNFSLKIPLLIIALNIAMQHSIAQTSVDGSTQPSINTIAQFTNLPDGIKKITDEDAYTQYAVYNDAKAVFVKLYITDSLQKRKVLKNGVELWIDVKGKKNKVTGILFPLAITGNNYLGGGNRNAAGGPPPSFQNNNKKSADTSLAILVAKRQEMELKGFGDNINGQHNISNAPLGISAGLQMAGDTLVYSAVVPLGLLGNNALADKPISIGIVEKGIELPGFGDMDGGPGGDGGGPPGGGDGGPPPGPPPGDFQDGASDFKRLFESNVIWYKLKMHS